MCGIAGYLTNAGELPDRTLLKRMCDRLIHRGPDGYGCFIDQHAALGHRRLSIIDLSTGAQPIANEDGTIQVVLNGEIYNYREIRAELQQKGHRFATQSDTEVLAHLYEEVGERLAEFVNGMFAFAVWDSVRESLLLVRDRLGKKPLYYSSDLPGLRFCFASELKALTAVPGFHPRVNQRAVADFLSLSYVPDPDTIYDNIYKLAPGHTLLATRSDVRTRRYWQAEFSADAGASDPTDSIEEIRTLALDAVKRRMISDVPLGVFLSGGVDSSAVAGLMAAQSRDRVKTFSIGFTNNEFDELDYARIAAAHNGADHHEEVVSASIEDVLPVLVEHFDEPFGDSSAIPALYLARMARKHVTVALCGDGADELFGGYRRYYFGMLEERLRSKFPEWFRKSAIRLGGRYYPKFDYLPRAFRGKTLLSNLAQEFGDAYFTSVSTFRDSGLNAVLSPGRPHELADYSPREKFRGLFHSVRHLPPLAQMQWVDWQTYLPGDILVKTDRATMTYSLEGRAPWLDYRLAELSARLPSSFKIRGRTGKYIFKQAVSPYVPPAILERTKMGFSVPLAEWFRTSLRPIFQSLVLNREMEEFLSLGEAKRIWNEHQSRLHNHDRKLWNLLMLAAWNASHRRHVRCEMTGRAESPLPVCP